jgi:hypothetical protein
MGASSRGMLAMCDYSLHYVTSRAARVGDRLTSRNFGTGTRGFAASEDANTAVCVLPGTELAFSREVACRSYGFLGLGSRRILHRTAIFRQVNKDQPRVHHDALEFPDGQTVLLTDLSEGQEATVLQLPAQPATALRSASLISGEGRAAVRHFQGPLLSRRPFSSDQPSTKPRQ